MEVLRKVIHVGLNISAFRPRKLGSQAIKTGKTSWWRYICTKQLICVCIQVQSMSTEGLVCVRNEVSILESKTQRKDWWGSNNFKNGVRGKRASNFVQWNLQNYIQTTYIGPRACYGFSTQRVNIFGGISDTYNHLMHYWQTHAKSFLVYKAWRILSILMFTLLNALCTHILKQVQHMEGFQWPQQCEKTPLRKRSKIVFPISTRIVASTNITPYLSASKEAIHSPIYALEIIGK